MPTTDPLTSSPFTLVPFEGGLRVVGSAHPSGTEIGFGRDWGGVADTVSSVLGAPMRTAPCGARTAVTWRSGLVLLHDGKAFIGVGCPLG